VSEVEVRKKGTVGGGILRGVECVGVDKRAAAPRRQRQGGRPCARAVRRAALAVDEVELAGGIQTFRPMTTCG
jgi:hypothetical protein